LHPLWAPAIITVMKVRQSPDWTGVAPPSEPIAPLTAETFVARLNALSEAPQ